MVEAHATYGIRSNMDAAEQSHSKVVNCSEMF